VIDSVTASGIGQRYGRRRVFTGLDFELRPGVTGVLGPNGAGKTTLLRTLATISQPSSGVVRYGEEAPDSFSKLENIRQDIGYLPQEFGYFGSFSVLDFVSYCGWLRGCSSRAVRALAVDAIERVDLAGRRADKMKRLSGGMLRRAGIASAIVGNPSIILLDEPTVGLDPEQRLHFRELLRSIDGAIVVLSTHMIDDVSAVCDRTLVLAEGALGFDGTPAELSARGDERMTGDNKFERGYMSILSEEKPSA